MMQLLCCLFIIKDYFEISVGAVYIKGQDNMGQTLSRNNLYVILTQALRADWCPTPVPKLVVELILVQQPDWLSPNWSQLFKNGLL